MAEQSLSVQRPPIVRADDLLGVIGEWKECIPIFRAPGRAISPSSGLNPEAARLRPRLIPQEASREDVAAVYPEDTKGASRYMQLSQELTAFSCSK